MQERPYMRNGEKRIIQALDEAKANELTALSYLELKDRANLSDPVLSSYLKNLQKLELITRDIDTRKYFLSEDNGAVAVKIIKLIKLLNEILTKNDYHPMKKYDAIIEETQRELTKFSRNL